MFSQLCVKTLPPESARASRAGFGASPNIFEMIFPNEYRNQYNNDCRRAAHAPTRKTRQKGDHRRSSHLVSRLPRKLSGCSAKIDLNSYEYRILNCNS